MPTPKSGYYSKEGTRLPSVTTIIGRFKDSGALIAWANRIAYEPYREMRAWVERVVEQTDCRDEDLDFARQNLLNRPANFCSREAWTQKEADIGTIVHARIDAHIRGQEFNWRQFFSKSCVNPMAVSEAGFSAFLEWSKRTKLKLAEGEMQLVSKKYSYGGTPDVIAISGVEAIGDWKTGKPYPEQVLPQLAAYRNLLIENGRKKMKGSGGNVIYVDKKSGGFTHRYFTPKEMDSGWEIFVKMNELYGALKELKG